jgi:hypothetical protein
MEKIMASTVIKDGRMYRINPKNSKQIKSSDDKGVNWTWLNILYLKILEWELE